MTRMPDTVFLGVSGRRESIPGITALAVSRLFTAHGTFDKDLLSLDATQDPHFQPKILSWPKFASEGRVIHRCQQYIYLNPIFGEVALLLTAFYICQLVNYCGARFLMASYPANCSAQSFCSLQLRHGSLHRSSGGRWDA